MTGSTGQAELFALLFVVGRCSSLLIRDESGSKRTISLLIQLYDDRRIFPQMTGMCVVKSPPIIFVLFP